MNGILTSIVLAGMFFLASCSDQSSTGPEEKRIEDILAEGWEAFEANDYATAVTRFTDVTKSDSNLVEAYNGLGWSYLLSNNLVSAVGAFTTGLAKNSNHNDIRAGLAFVYAAQKLYAESNAIGLALLQSSPDWLFARRTHISATDLRLVLAVNYFSQGDFSSSLAQVRLLNPAFTANVSVLEGKEALAREIERLRSLV